MFVYTIQPVVKLVWQPVVSCIQTFNRFSNLFDNRFDNRLYHVYNRLSNRLYNPVWQPVEWTAAVRSTRLSNGLWQPAVSCKQTSNWLSYRLSNRLTTGWMFVYTMQPVVKPVVQPVWQPAVLCKRGLTVWSGVGPRNHVFDGGPYSPWEGAILRERRRPIVKYREYHTCVAVMQSFVKLLWPFVFKVLRAVC